MSFQLLFTYLPVMQTLFHSAALDLRAWAVAAAVASSVYVIIELEKAIVRAVTGNGRRVLQ
jgi:hypothetical protein